MKKIFQSNDFFPKRFLLARRPAGPLITGDGDEAESFSEVSGLEEIGKLTGNDDLKALLKKQDEINMMSDEDFRIEFGFDGPDEDIADEKIAEHEKLTKEFQARITEAEKKGLNAMQGLSPLDISTITEELEAELQRSEVETALGDHISETLQRLNTGAGLTPDTAENLSLAYLEHKTRKEELKRLNDAQAALKNRINASKKTRDELTKEYNKDLEEFSDQHPILSALGIGRVKLFFTRWDRFNSWFSGKDFSLTEEVGGIAMNMESIKADLGTAESSFGDAEQRLTNLKRDFASRKEMANTVFQSLDEKMKNLKTSLAALNRRIGLSANPELLAQRNEIVDKIAVLKKSHILAKTIAKSMKMLDEKAQKAPVDAAELSAMSGDIEADGLKAAYEKVAQRNAGRTKKAREEIGPMDIEGIKTDMEGLTASETAALSGVIKKLGNASRNPGEDSALLQSKTMSNVQDHLPRLFALLEKLTKVAPADMVHNKIFRNLQSNVDYQNKEFVVLETKARAEFSTLPASLKTQLTKKSVLDSLIIDDHLEMPEDFFQNDFRNEAQLMKYVQQNASFAEMKSFTEAISKLKPDASGNAELIIDSSGKVEKTENVDERLKAEAQAAFNALGRPIKAALQADTTQLSSISLKGFTPVPPLPSAAMASNFEEYLETCNAGQLRTLKSFLVQLKKRGQVYGVNQVLDVSEAKKLEAEELLDQISVMDPARGLDGAKDCFLKNPKARFEKALEILKRFGAIGRKNFSASFAGLGVSYPDEKALLAAVTNDDDLGLMVQILRQMPDRIMTIPFDVSLDMASRARIADKKDYEFYSIEMAQRDIQENMNNFLRFAGTNDLANISEINNSGGQNIKTLALRDVQATPAGITISGRPLNDPANRKHFPYLLITMDHLAGNINDGVAGHPNALEKAPGSVAPNIILRERGGAMGNIEGSFYDINGTQVA